MLEQRKGKLSRFVRFEIPVTLEVEVEVGEEKREGGGMG